LTGIKPPPASGGDKERASVGFGGFLRPFPALQKNLKKMFETR
jgi:hypothetical protein